MFVDRKLLLDFEHDDAHNEQDDHVDVSVGCTAGNSISCDSTPYQLT